MQIDKWTYYNHAVIPKTAPHEKPDMRPIENGDIWKIGGGYPLLARWTTEFDCNRETNWWYVIKDTPFDISALKAKRRYEVNRGKKYFRVEKINPLEYKEDLYNVQTAAFSAYPKKYSPIVDKKSFLSGVEKWGKFMVFAAFFRESGEMGGYALLSQENPDCVEFNVLKTKPKYEKLSVNASLVAEILSFYHEYLLNGGYICDGARSINHETHFQEYLEKYFGFRKAYCKLQIRYNPKIGWLIKALFPLRKLLLAFDGVGLIHSVNGVMKMEEFCRNDVCGNN